MHFSKSSKKTVTQVVAAAGASLGLGGNAPADEYSDASVVLKSSQNDLRGSLLIGISQQGNFQPEKL
jgi:hypothetical protein